MSKKKKTMNIDILKQMKVSLDDASKLDISVENEILVYKNALKGLNAIEKVALLMLDISDISNDKKLELANQLKEVRKYKAMFKDKLKEM